MQCNSRNSLNFNIIVKGKLLCFNNAGLQTNEKFCLEVENNKSIKPKETFSFLEPRFWTYKKATIPWFVDSCSTLKDFTIELVDYNLSTSCGQVEAELVKMTLRQMDAG